MAGIDRHRRSPTLMLQIYVLSVLDISEVCCILFHMLVFYWHTCHVAVGSRVTSSLDHVSYFYWSTWPFLIRPRVTALSVHVLHFYLAMWLDDILPCVKGPNMARGG